MNSKKRIQTILAVAMATAMVLGAISLLERMPNIPDDELRQQIGMIRRNVETEARLVDETVGQVLATATSTLLVLS